MSQTDELVYAHFQKSRFHGIGYVGIIISDNYGGLDRGMDNGDTLCQCLCRHTEGTMSVRVLAYVWLRHIKHSRDSSWWQVHTTHVLPLILIERLQPRMALRDRIVLYLHRILDKIIVMLHHDSNASIEVTCL